MNNETTWTFGGVQITEKEHAAISAAVARGTCPYCLRQGLKSNYGAKGKHMRACGARLTLLGKEKVFAEVIADSKREVRHHG